LRAENERLLAENARLRSQLEAARRAGKRQAAPFSKGDPRSHPRRAGRQRGAVNDSCHDGQSSPLLDWALSAARRKFGRVELKELRQG
jgi:hypothetical protein